MKSNIALAALLAFGTTTIASATTFVVNKTGDDGSTHTLRWAIEQNNLNPVGNRILIIPSGPDLPFVIKLNSLLPPVIGPVTIEGKNRIVPYGVRVECQAKPPGAHPHAERPGLRGWRSSFLQFSDLGKPEEAKQIKYHGATVERFKNGSVGTMIGATYVLGDLNAIDIVLTVHGARDAATPSC